jgi:transposase-like protein
MLLEQRKPAIVEKDGIKCKKCGSERHVKAGFIKGHQRYRCKNCGCQFVPALSWRRRSDNQKIVALFLYVSGLSMRRIAVMLAVDLHAVFRWIRDYGRKHYEKPEPQGEAVEVELDEMWGYLHSKKKAGFGCGRLIVAIPVSLLIGSVVDATMERLCVFTSG